MRTGNHRCASWRDRRRRLYVSSILVDVVVVLVSAVDRALSLRARGEVFGAQHELGAAPLKGLLHLGREDARFVDNRDAGPQVIRAVRVEAVGVPRVRFVVENLREEVLVVEALLEIQITPILRLRGGMRGSVLE